MLIIKKGTPPKKKHLLGIQHAKGSANTPRRVQKSSTKPDINAEAVFVGVSTDVAMLASLASPSPEPLQPLTLPVPISVKGGSGASALAGGGVNSIGAMGGAFGNPVKLLSISFISSSLLNRPNSTPESQCFQDPTARILAG